MGFSDDDAMARRLGAFLNGRIGQHLARREQKESFALYAHGILGEGERKSVEPIAARATGGVEQEEDTGPRGRNPVSRIGGRGEGPWGGGNQEAEPRGRNLVSRIGGRGERP